MDANPVHILHTGIIIMDSNYWEHHMKVKIKPVDKMCAVPREELRLTSEDEGAAIECEHWGRVVIVGMFVGLIEGTRVDKV